MNKSLLLFFLLFGLFHLVPAQTITILDAETRTPLPYVTISSVSPFATALTDERGRAAVSAFQQSDSIYFQLLGYETKLLSYKLLREKRFSILLKPTRFNLQEIVVSSTRWSQPRRELSQRLSSIRASDISLGQPQTAADLLAGTGEVFIQKSQQGGGSPMIRGFATNRLLIAVDGVRMNNAIFRSGNLQNVISVDPYSLQSAEVLFGPGSVIYGSDAIGGVMLFSTYQPRLSDDSSLLVKGNVSARYASANHENSLHFDLMLGGQRFASFTSLSFNRFGDLRMGRHGRDEYLRPEYVQRIDGTDRLVSNPDPLVQTPTGYEQQNLTQKFRFSPGEKLDMTYGFYYSSTGDYSRYDRLLRYRQGKPRSAVWNYGPQLWLMNNFILTHREDNALYDQLRLTLAVQRFEESRHDRDFGLNTLRNRYEKVNALSLNLDLNKSLGAAGRLLYGAEIIHNDVISTGTDQNIETAELTNAAARYPLADWRTMAVFGTYQHRVSPALLLQGGMRYSWFWLNADFDTSFYALPFTSASLSKGALNGSVGMVWNPEAKTSLSANFSSGFRAPNVDDMGKIFDSEPRTVMVPNPELRPEYAWNTDLGAAKTFGEWVRADFTVFYTLLHDALVRREFQLNGADSLLYNGEMSRVLAIQNAARAEVYGLQASLEFMPGRGFSVYSVVTWQKGEEELDDGSRSPLRHAAPLFGMSRLRYSAGKVQAEINLLYSAEVSHSQMPQEEIAKDYMYARDENGQAFSPAWYSLNFKVLVRPVQNLQLSANIENITDQRYRPYSSGLTAPGRNFLFAVGYRF